MNIFLLVHGSWHGAWCWKKVIPLLEKEGYILEAPDLPGHGDDKTPISEITFKSYTDRICQILDNQSEPVILVGHSFGGVIITQVAEYLPEKIKVLIYLSAILLRNGESHLKMLPKFLKGSLILPNLIQAKDMKSSTIKKEAIKEVFYDDCSAEDVEFAKSLLTPEPISPFIEPIHITEERFGQIPRIYIETLRDKTITLSAQREMQLELPCEKVLSLDTSHSPFFSAPDALVHHLLKISEKN